MFLSPSKKENWKRSLRCTESLCDPKLVPSILLLWWNLRKKVKLKRLFLCSNCLLSRICLCISNTLPLVSPRKLNSKKKRKMRKKTRKIKMKTINHLRTRKQFLLRIWVLTRIKIILRLSLLKLAKYLQLLSLKRRVLLLVRDMVSLRWKLKNLLVKL